VHGPVLAGDLEGCVPVVLLDPERLLLLLGELAGQRAELVPRDDKGPASEGAVAGGQPNALPMGGQFLGADLRQDGRLEVGSHLLERGVAQPLDAGGVLGDPRLQPLSPRAGVERDALTELAGDLFSPLPLARLAGPLAGVGHGAGDEGVAEVAGERRANAIECGGQGIQAGERGRMGCMANTDTYMKPVLIEPVACEDWRVDAGRYPWEQRPLNLTYVVLMSGGHTDTVVNGQLVYSSRFSLAEVEAIRERARYHEPSRPIPTQLDPQNAEHLPLRSGEHVDQRHRVCVCWAPRGEGGHLLAGSLGIDGCAHHAVLRLQ
jgi:hypothetical protein